MRVALLLDDSDTARHLVASQLRAIGYSVVEAVDGEDGLAKLAGANPDVVLVDWNMPRMNGLEFVRAVRADASRGGLRLLMVTTEVELHRVQEALVAGANEYLMKPFTREMLADKLALLGLGGDA